MSDAIIVIKIDERDVAAARNALHTAVPNGKDVVVYPDGHHSTITGRSPDTERYLYSSLNAKVENYLASARNKKEKTKPQTVRISYRYEGETSYKDVYFDDLIEALMVYRQVYKKSDPVAWASVQVNRGGSEWIAVESTRN